MQMFYHNRRFTDHGVSGIPVLDPSLRFDPVSPTHFSPLSHTVLYCYCSCYYWSLVYRNILCSRSDSLRSCRMPFWMSDCILPPPPPPLFFFFPPTKWCTDSAIWLLHCWCHMKLLPSRRKLCVHHTTVHQFTVSPHSKIGRVRMCLAVTCHLHSWQNGLDLLRATATTRVWGGSWNKSQHRKLTLKRKIRPPLPRGPEPGTFRSRLRRSNHWPIPAPLTLIGWRE